MWLMWQKQIGVLVLLCLVGSLVLTEGVQTGIICRLMNDAGGVLQTFNQFDCSSCWFHCIMSPACVKIYYTFDGACHDEEAQVENFTVQSEEDFRSPSETCLQLDESFGNPLADACPVKRASVHRMLKPEAIAQYCGLYTADNHLMGDLASVSCADCQSRCLSFAAQNSPNPGSCANYYYTNDNMCYTLYPTPDDGSECAAADAKLYEPLNETCKAMIKGDPHFKGFGNQPFEFQGFAGGIFNIYSDPAHQVNALFASIGHPDRTYVGAVAIMYGPNRVRVLVSVQHCVHPQDCRMQVQLDNKSVVGSEGRGRVTAVDGGVKLQGIGGLNLEVVLSTFPGVVSAKQVHGVVGQTMRWPAYPHARLVGDEMDYVASHLFATDSMFDMYVAANASVWHVHY